MTKKIYELNEILILMLIYLKKKIYKLHLKIITNYNFCIYIYISIIKIKMK